MNHEFAKYEKDGKVLRIFYDDTPENPREWDNLGTMVCWHRRYDLGDEHNYSDPREFLESLATDFLNTESGKEVIAKLADKEFNKYSVVYDKDKKGYVIEAEDGWNLFRGYVYETQEEAEDDLRQQHEFYMDNPLLDELEDEELWSIFEPHIIILPLYLYDHSGITMRTSKFSCPWDSGQVGWIYATKDTLRKETGYTEDELFSKDKYRTPKVGERVKIKGFEDREFAQVISADENGVFVDWDYNKALNYRKPENKGYFKYDQVAEVMSNVAVQILEGEVEIYDQYLRGDVYGYVIEEKIKCEHCGAVDFEHIDSCWGFYGDNFLENGMIDHVGEEWKEFLR